MITLEHIKIYKFYRDGDYFVRMSTDKEKKIMSYKDWLMIDNFLQDLLLVNKGKASESFRNRLFQKLIENCKNQLVIDKLIQLAS